MTYRGHMRNGVAVLDTPADLPDGTAVFIDVIRRESEFWDNKDVEDLAREQSVKPVSSLDDLAGDWPAEDSVDEFLALIRKVRR